MSEPLEVLETLSWSPRGQNYFHNDTKTLSFSPGGQLRWQYKSSGGQEDWGPQESGCRLQSVAVVMLFSSVPVLKKIFFKVLFLNVFDETVKMNDFIKSQCLNIHHSSFS